MRTKGIGGKDRLLAPHFSPGFRIRLAFRVQRDGWLIERWSTLAIWMTFYLIQTIISPDIKKKNWIEFLWPADRASRLSNSNLSERLPIWEIDPWEYSRFQAPAPPAAMKSSLSITTNEPPEPTLSMPLAWMPFFCSFEHVSVPRIQGHKDGPKFETVPAQQ